MKRNFHEIFICKIVRSCLGWYLYYWADYNCGSDDLVLEYFIQLIKPRLMTSSFWTPFEGLIRWPAPLCHNSWPSQPGKWRVFATLEGLFQRRRTHSFTTHLIPLSFLFKLFNMKANDFTMQPCIPLGFASWIYPSSINLFSIICCFNTIVILFKSDKLMEISSNLSLIRWYNFYLKNWFTYFWIETKIV